MNQSGATNCGALHAALPAVPATLMIPLVARAYGQQWFPWLDCQDGQAQRLLACLQAPVQAALADRLVVLNVLWRTRVIKEWGRRFFAAHPAATGVALGSGLSYHFQWLDGGRNHWIDADLPQVHDIRERLLPASTQRINNQAVDLLRPGWWNRLLPQSPLSPVWVLCEGVLMYFTPNQVAAVVAEFAECAPGGSHLVFDVISHAGVGRAQECLSLVQSGAQFRWGLRATTDLLQYHPRLRLAATRSVSECYGWWGWAAEMAGLPWIGVPLYGMLDLEVVARPRVDRTGGGKKDQGHT